MHKARPDHYSDPSSSSPSHRSTVLAFNASILHAVTFQMLPLLPFALLWSVHGFKVGVTAQAMIEPAPAQVVLQHAQTLLDDDQASQCERAVRCLKGV